MSMTDQEKADFEKAIREKALMERRAYQAEWRRKNKESIRRSNKKYYEKIKAQRGQERYADENAGH